MKKLKGKGFRFLLLGVLVIVGITGYLAYGNGKKSMATEVRWAYDQQNDAWYISQGTAPACKEPFVFDTTPVDLRLATSVGFPGTYRGNDYKVHGMFALAESSIVKLPADAALSGMVRYYEGDPAELQYKVNFETDCGVAFYFDHLYTLSPQLQKLADTLPEPRPNETRVDPNDTLPRLKMKAGDIVAAETGAHQVQRYGIDFGVIDYRRRNAISHNPKWVALHGNFKASEWYGVCWFDMLPGDDAAKARQLSLVQSDKRKTAQFVSDYCGNADYKTIDLYDGHPVEAY